MRSALFLTLAPFVFAAEPTPPAPNLPPSWKNEQFTLPEALRGQSYEASLPEDAAQDPEGKSLKFRVASGPGWLKIDNSARLRGVPGKKDRGPQTWEVEASDGKSKAIAKITLTVGNRGPAFASDTWQMPPTIEEARSEAAFPPATDADADKLEYRLVNAPAWAVLKNNKITATPPVGTSPGAEFGLEAFDGEATAQLKIKIAIEEKNQAPRLGPLSPVTAKEREVLDRDLAAEATDPNKKDTLTFTAQKLPSWITLSADGKLHAEPLFAHIGTHTLSITVTDGKLKATAPFTLQIDRNPRAPVWAEKLPAFALKSREPFKASAALATDLDKLNLTYSKVSGPLWLQISPRGEVSGTPEDKDAGRDTLVVAVANDRLSAQARLDFQVEKKNYPPTLAKPLSFTQPERSQPEWDLTDFFRDPDGENLRFKAVSLPAFMSLDERGILKAQPLHAHLGKHSFQIQATDREETLSVPATLQIERSAQAPVWAQQLPAFEWLSRDPVQVALAPLVKDLDGVPVRLETVLPLPWLSLNARGELTGTPPDAAAGSHRLEVRALNDGAVSTAKFSIRVIKKNYPPQLVKAVELTLKERQTHQLDLGALGAVADPDAERLEYKISGLPAWFVLQPSGRATLTPQFAQIGVHKFTAQVSDKEASVALPITLTIVRNPRGPQWEEAPLAWEMLSREPFRADLKGQATDLDGKPFRYALGQGPAWLKVSPTGEVTGNPTDSDVAVSSIVLVADNGDVATPRTVRLKVAMKNHPPVVHAEQWKLSCRERQTCRWNLAAMPYADDVDRDRLTLASRNALPAWLTLSPSGNLEAKPAFAQIGSHGFDLTIADAKDTVAVRLALTIERDPRPPVWNAKVLNLSSKAREAIALSLETSAQDLDGLPVRFTLKSGPPWLQVAPNGKLSGTPGDEHVAKHPVAFTVANDLRSAEVQGLFEVLYKNHPPSWKDTRPLLGKGKAEEPVRTTVAALAQDIDPNDALTFEKVRGPAWAIVAPNGSIFGKPPKTGVGMQEIVVRVLDSERESAEMSARFEVEPERAKPVPKNSEIRFPRAYRGELFIYDLDKDFGQPKLQYELLSGPQWLKLRPTGEFAGIPESVGEFDVSFQVSNKRHTVQYKGRVQVLSP